MVQRGGVLLTRSRSLLSWRCGVTVEGAVSRCLPLALSLPTAWRPPGARPGRRGVGDNVCTFTECIVLVELGLSRTSLSEYGAQEVADFILNRNTSCCRHQNLQLNRAGLNSESYVQEYSGPPCFELFLPASSWSWSFSTGHRRIQPQLDQYLLPYGYAYPLVPPHYNWTRTDK